MNWNKDQGLGDDEDAKEEERTYGCLKEWLENTKLNHNEMVPKETEESHVFETKILCVNASFARKEGEQPAEVVKKEKEDMGVSKRDRRG